jgi:CBS domain-containing protein
VEHAYRFLLVLENGDPRDPAAFLTAIPTGAKAAGASSVASFDGSDPDGPASTTRITGTSVGEPHAHFECSSPTSFRGSECGYNVVSESNSKGGRIVAKKVRDVMTPSVHAAAPTESLADAAQAMKDENVGSLPVVEGGRVVGMITDRDIVVRAVAERADPQSITVGDVFSREPVTVAPDQDLNEALALMARHRVRRLPVVESGSLVGVLAQADVALEAKEKDSGELLEEISQPTSTPRE